MKRAAFFVTIMTVILGSTGLCLAQMHGERGHMMREKGMMGGMHGMMGKNMIATSDGGVVVMVFNKLYKYDKDLNLKKEVEVPLDFEHMKKVRMQMRDMGMMWEREEGAKTSGPKVEPGPKGQR
jgi:uncharacterized membrane protein